MTKLLLANLVYGERYARLLLDCWLPAVLDPSNLPAVKSDARLEVYTDQPTAEIIKAHPNWQREGVPADLHVLPIPTDAYQARYSLQAVCFHRSLHRAHAEGRALWFSTADTIYGKGVIPGVLAKMDAGHDAVIGVTMRGTAEPMADRLKDVNRACTASELYKGCRHFLHPLWLASNWNAPDFSHIPYTLLWSDREQIIARSVTMTPIAFVPNPAMLTLPPQTPDMMVDPYVQSPYFAYDWSEFPIIELQYLDSFWPPFSPGPASAETFKAWAKGASPFGTANLRHAFHYYDVEAKPSVERTQALRAQSDAVVETLL